MKLSDRAFQATVKSRIQDRTRHGWATDFHSVAGDLLDRGLVPEHRSMWEWARRICEGPRRAA